ncbi:hypothetical protein [Burkholderia glumae]|uniref:hypothetical protein n=1 Tax=Burkholderia glumae TaxID=337 RepID=UPI0021512013|nr:hypothetical protein [Burkholderia glumae]
MNDRELLELAAKAAGFVGFKWENLARYGKSPFGFDEAIWSQEIYQERGSGYWNPLEDDGDALRLAVKLRMDIDISINAGYVSVTAHREPDERVFIVEKPGDSAEALRRAITRAAAEIARTTDTGGEA